MGAAYRVHAGNKCIIRGRVISGRDEEATSLGRPEVDHLGLRLLGKDAVDLNDSNIVPLEPDVLASECANVDHVKEIRFPGLDWYGEVLRIVE